VPTKTPVQQRGLVLHRTRHLFIRQQTSVINAIRSPCRVWGHRTGRRKGTEGLYVSSPIRATNGCPMLCVHALPRWAANCSTSKS
jgi:hypothetical protein